MTNEVLGLLLITPIVWLSMTVLLLHLRRANGYPLDDVEMASAVLTTGTVILALWGVYVLSQ